MNINTLINTTNIKLTTARTHILEIFQNAKKPLCYEDIRGDLSMDKATFYRNISKFEEENIVNSFESNDKKRYFELKKKPHAHFVCICCNGVECIENIEISLVGYEVNNVIINGKCKKCLEGTL